jgi:hypothetical protein
MLGDKIGEASGKITGMKVLEYAGEKSRFEVTFQGRGQISGVAMMDIGSYVQEVRPNQVLYGEGGPLWMTEEGELLSWKGFGVGHSTGPGFSASFGVCGAIQTSSAKLAHLNGVAAVGEYQIDEEGGYRWTLWEWKGAGQ